MIESFRKLVTKLRKFRFIFRQPFNVYQLIPFQRKLHSVNFNKNKNSNFQWSLRSTINPDTRDMWTDTYKTTTDDYFIPSDRSDSGITSPYNQQHSDDFSHCDLPVRVWSCRFVKQNFLEFFFFCYSEYRTHPARWYSETCSCDDEKTEPWRRG